MNDIHSIALETEMTGYILSIGGYETMVFDADGVNVTDWTERDFARYVTEEDARVGHEAMVEKWAKVQS